MKGNYDSVAAFYDTISRFVFGKAIINANAFLVSLIPPGSRVLIIGGGTGLILEQISTRHPRGLEITYVDMSSKMIELSKKRNTAQNNISFINSSILNTELLYTYEVVITAFLFDNFLQHTADNVFNLIEATLQPKATWLIADFRIDSKQQLWQKPLLKTMYAFFRLFCQIEASKLPNIHGFFKRNKYELVTQSFFYKKFVFAEQYRKK